MSFPTDIFFLLLELFVVKTNRSFFASIERYVLNSGVKGLKKRSFLNLVHSSFFDPRIEFTFI